MKNTPALKGDIEQSLRIFLKQPILLKSEKIKENTIHDYLYKIYKSIHNKIFNYGNKIKKIEINIPFESLEIIKKNRKEALKYKKLIIKEKVDGFIIYNNKRYNAKFRLKGDFKEHWEHKKQWSLRVQLKKNKAIEGMNEFALTIHGERDFPNNYLIYNVLKRYNILTPKYVDFRIIFNGEDWGLMLAEEQMSETFYAFNQLKEAPIFKMTNDKDTDLHMRYFNTPKINDIVRWQGVLESKIYNEKKIRKKTNIPKEKTNDDLITLFSSIQEILVINDKKYDEQIINYLNIEKFAEAFVITSIFGDDHSKHKMNSRYYINPYTLKIEPILTDFFSKSLSNKFYQIYDREHAIYYFLLENQKFKERAREVMFELKDETDNFKSIISEICKPYGINCSHIYKHYRIKKNIKTLTNYLSKPVVLKTKKDISNNLKFNTFSKDVNQKKIHFRVFNNGELLFYNLTSEKIELNKIIFYQNSAKQEFILNSILDKSEFEKISRKKIKLNIDKKNFSKAILEFSYYKKKFFTEVEVENSQFSQENLALDSKNIFRNFIISQNEYRIAKGNYFVNQPIVIPEGNNLIIESGVNLIMNENTFIEVRNGKIEINGDEKLPVVIKSNEKDKFWKGIYVFNKNKNLVSKIKNTKMYNVGYFNNNKIKLTGAINLISSNYRVNNVIIDNIKAEDAMNIVNSNVNLKDIKIMNSASDAIDLDFASGDLKNIFLNNIGGDGIDTSGSNLKLDNLIADRIGDKGISAGEISTINISNIEISNTKIGIASKDSSKVYGNRIDISNSKFFDLAAYVKKSYFGGGLIEIKNLKDKTFEKILSQKRSVIRVNGSEIPSVKYNIKKIY